MTDPTAQEPTMEEILASIRRIISEDDAPAETPAAEMEPEPVVAAPDPTPAPALIATAEPEPEPMPGDEDVLELTDIYEAPAAAETIGDLDVFMAEPEPEPAPRPEPAKPTYDSLVGESAAASAASAFAGLASSLKKPEPPPPVSDMAFLSGSTVEGMVVEMLKPMLKNWLDSNLPGIVEKAVKAEVERIARSA